MAAAADNHLINPQWFRTIAANRHDVPAGDDNAIFIDKHGLWTDEQRRQAQEIARRVEAEKLQFIRLAWADPHGAARLRRSRCRPSSAPHRGHNINVATTTLDSANAACLLVTRGAAWPSEMTARPISPSF